MRSDARKTVHDIHYACTIFGVSSRTSSKRVQSRLAAGQISKASAQSENHRRAADIARRRLFAYFLAAQKVGDNMGGHAAELFSKPDLVCVDRVWGRALRGRFIQPEHGIGGLVSMFIRSEASGRTPQLASGLNGPVNVPESGVPFERSPSQCAA